MPIRIVSASLFISAIFFLGGYGKERQSILNEKNMTDEQNNKNRLFSLNLKIAGAIFLVLAAFIQLYRTFSKPKKLRPATIFD